MVRMRLRDDEFDTRVVPWGYDQKIVEWLGEQYIRWDGENLYVRDGEGREVCTHPGHVFSRFDDGVLVISSPQAAAKHYEPVEPGPGDDIREGRVTRHENADAMFEHLNKGQ